MTVATNPTSSPDVFTFRPAALEEIMRAHALIPEFDIGGDDYFQSRLEGKRFLSMVAWDGEAMAGYAVAYLDGSSTYVWLAGTDPSHRRRGAFSGIYGYIRRWAADNGSANVRLKTFNKFPGMLRWLVRNQFMIVAVEQGDTPLENRIVAERTI